MNYRSNKLLAACAQIDHCRYRVCSSGTNQRCLRCNYYGGYRKAYRLASNNGYSYRICESKYIRWLCKHCYMKTSRIYWKTQVSNQMKVIISMNVTCPLVARSTESVQKEAYNNRSTLYVTSVTCDSQK